MKAKRMTDKARAKLLVDTVLEQVHSLSTKRLTSVSNELVWMFDRRKGQEHMFVVGALIHMLRVVQRLREEPKYEPTELPMVLIARPIRRKGANRRT